MNKKRIPITEAKRISKLYGQNQVIIVTWDKTNNRQHVVTYGKSIVDCAQAASGGNFVKKALGWPEKLCQAIPARIKKNEIVSLISKWDNLECRGCSPRAIYHDFLFEVMGKLRDLYGLSGISLRLPSNQKDLGT